MSGTAENTDAEYSDADFAEYVDELDAIANDPTLTDAEKQDAIDKTVEEELAELSGADTVTATEAGVDAATANLTDPTATAIPEETTVSDPTTTDLNERLDNLDAAIDDLELPNADVVGDPSTASYGTTTTSAPAAEPAPVADPAPVAEESAPVVEPAPAAAATTGQNASIGVDGNVDYYSPRDVDRDGNVDVIHSRVDGVDTITHVDDNGEITLVEQDLDFNGTYETAAAPRPGGTVRVAEDSDDDGDVDLATFYNETGERYREDVIDGARITETKFDTDGDGRFDTASLDTDSDGYTNEELIDVDGDGRFDVRVADDNGDGTLESTLVDTVGDGCLGDISTYESLIPADDSYHTQAGTDVYEAPATDSVVTGDLA